MEFSYIMFYFFKETEKSGTLFALCLILMYLLRHCSFLHEQHMKAAEFLLYEGTISY